MCNWRGGRVYLWHILPIINNAYIKQKLSLLKTLPKAFVEVKRLCILMWFEPLKGLYFFILILNFETLTKVQPEPASWQVPSQFHLIKYLFVCVRTEFSQVRGRAERHVFSFKIFYTHGTFHIFEFAHERYVHLNTTEIMQGIWQEQYQVNTKNSCTVKAFDNFVRWLICS